MLQCRWLLRDAKSLLSAGGAYAVLTHGGAGSVARASPILQLANAGFSVPRTASDGGLG